jgi:hypothetical protein
MPAERFREVRRMRGFRSGRLLVLFVPLLVAGGCVGVRRQLTVNSQPPGALVYMNGDEIGRTPLTYDFTYYGTMDLRLRKQGYETLEDKPKVWAPWWQIPPIDLIAEAFSATDRHTLSYELTPKRQDAPPEELVRRGEELREQLESSHVSKPTTAPVKSSVDAKGLKESKVTTPSGLSTPATPPPER